MSIRFSDATSNFSWNMLIKEVGMDGGKQFKVFEKSPNLFDYFDYREFLQDYYHHHKQKNSSYSYRLFARKAKLGSPNYLKLVVDGKRRITDRTLYQFARGLGLNREEEKYFRELVLYQEVSDPDSKQTHLKALLKYQEKQKVPSFLKSDRTNFIVDWYHAVVRELVGTTNFKDDPEWISSRIGNKITKEQAAVSLQLLIKLKLIQKKADGKYEIIEPLLSTTDEIPSHLVRNLHRTYIRKILANIFSHPVASRELSALVLSVPKKRIKELKDDIKEFRKKINRKYGTDPQSDEVYFLGLYLMPLTVEKSE